MCIIPAPATRRRRQKLTGLSFKIVIEMVIQRGTISLQVGVI